MKYIGVFSLVITLLGLLIGGITKFNMAEARVLKTEEKVAKVEAKVEELDKDSNTLDKVLVEQGVKLEYIQKSIEENSSNLKELVQELKKKR